MTGPGGLAVLLVSGLVSPVWSCIELIDLVLSSEFQSSGDETSCKIALLLTTRCWFLQSCSLLLVSYNMMGDIWFRLVLDLVMAAISS